MAEQKTINLVNGIDLDVLQGTVSAMVFTGKRHFKH